MKRRIDSDVLDQRIAAAWTENSLRNSAELAALVGTSASNVRRRMRRLKTQGKVGVRFPGMWLLLLFARFSGSIKTETLKQDLPTFLKEHNACFAKVLVVRTVLGGIGSSVNDADIAMCFDVGDTTEAEKVHRMMREFPGVEKVRALQLF